eukprot:6182835-Pleurochrysis_carterae.AAC.1
MGVSVGVGAWAWALVWECSYGHGCECAAWRCGSSELERRLSGAVRPREREVVKAGDVAQHLAVPVESGRMCTAEGRAPLEEPLVALRQVAAVRVQQLQRLDVALEASVHRRCRPVEPGVISVRRARTQRLAYQRQPIGARHESKRRPAPALVHARAASPADAAAAAAALCGRVDKVPVDAHEVAHARHVANAQRAQQPPPLAVPPLSRTRALPTTLPTTLMNALLNTISLHLLGGRPLAQVVRRQHAAHVALPEPLEEGVLRAADES